MHDESAPNIAGSRTEHRVAHVHGAACLIAQRSARPLEGRAGGGVDGAISVPEARKAPVCRVCVPTEESIGGGGDRIGGVSRNVAAEQADRWAGHGGRNFSTR
eukprot:2249188-Prymnesium_polylepis.1